MTEWEQSIHGLLNAFIWSLVSTVEHELILHHNNPNDAQNNLQFYKANTIYKEWPLGLILAPNFLTSCIMCQQHFKTPPGEVGFVVKCEPYCNFFFVMGQMGCWLMMMGWTDGTDSVPYWVTECAPLDENQNMLYFTENLNYLDKIMFSTIMLTFKTI